MASGVVSRLCRTTLHVAQAPANPKTAAAASASSRSWSKSSSSLTLESTACNLGPVLVRLLATLCPRPLAGAVGESCCLHELRVTARAVHDLLAVAAVVSPSSAVTSFGFTWRSMTLPSQTTRATRRPRVQLLRRLAQNEPPETDLRRKLEVGPHSWNDLVPHGQVLHCHLRHDEAFPSVCEQ